MRFLARLHSTSKTTRSVPLLLAILSNTALAFPVTYEFHGYVTDYHNSSSDFEAAPGERIDGTVTYDSAYDGTFYGGPWPTASALLNWSISIGENSYHQQSNLINPFTNYVTCCNNETISFSDEMPSNSDGLPLFDQAIFGFQFTELGDTVPASLTVENFVTGFFTLAGGEDPGATFSGVIDELNVKVPEAPILPLLGLGLTGIVAMKRRKVLSLDDRQPA